jgi:hypothetical protein
MIDLLAAVDAAPDPEPSNRYAKRFKGLVRDDPPKPSTKFRNKARRWMVDEEWLAKDENEKYDVESRIVNSGKAWGDDEDPEVPAEKRLNIKQEKKAITDEKKRKLSEVVDGKRAKKQKRAKKGKKSEERGGAVGGSSTVDDDGGLDFDD